MASPASTSSYSWTTPVSSVGLAPRHDLGGMHHDADEIVVPVAARPQVQHRQHRLRGDGQRHLVGDDEAVGAMEFLVAQEFRGQVAQALEVGRRADRPERVARERGPPGGVGNRGRRAQACAASRTSAQVDALRAGAGQAQQLRARPDGPRRPSRSARCAARPSPRAWSAGRCVWPWTSVRRAGLPQPVARGVGIDVGPDHAGAALAVLALRAHRARQRAALAPAGGRGRRACQAGVRTCGAEPQVLGVLEAERVAVAQQPALAVQRQHGRDRPAACMPHCAAKRGADQEVAVAVHEEHRPARCGRRAAPRRIAPRSRARRPRRRRPRPRTGRRG